MSEESQKLEKKYAWLEQENNRLQAEVDELKSYKEHHKTCLELAEEANRDIALERRINSSLRVEVERWKSEGINCEQELSQQLAEQRAENERLVEVLKSISDDLNCGDATHFCPNCDRSMYYIKKKANAALAAVERDDE